MSGNSTNESRQPRAINNTRAINNNRLPLTLGIRYFLLAVTFNFSCVHAGWADPLPFFTANYDATIKGFSLKATRVFQPLENNQAELSLAAESLIASISENSRFIWENDRIQPLRFSYQSNIIGRQSARSLTFNADKNTILSSYKKRQTELPNPLKALDTLSFQLQLQYDLLRQRDNLSYQIADKDRIKPYYFKIVDQEIIDTPIGLLKTTKVEIIREHKDRLTYLWMASDWHYLLTRIVQYEEGKKVFQLELTGATVGEKAVTAHSNAADSSENRKKDH
ncbi:MAG: hypothetical protein ACJA04_000704 [Cellvibrionaceae bacterium]|jgi:hypothetical protein